LATWLRPDPLGELTIASKRAPAPQAPSWIKGGRVGREGKRKKGRERKGKGRGGKRERD